MTQFEYRQFFPHPSVRNEQDVSITFTLDSFLNLKKKFVILELGTGCGKSAIGVTVSRYLNSIRQHEEAPKFGPGSYILTTQKVLQEQYTHDFGPPEGKLVSIKSSSNYKCDFYPGNTCGESMRLLKNEAKGSAFWSKCMFDCNYKHDKLRFLNSPESITNYSYFLAETRYAGAIHSRDLLILDEGHNIESELSKFVEVVVSEKFATEVLKLVWPATTNETKVIEWIKIEYVPRLNERIRQANEMIARFKLESKMTDFQNMAKEHDMLDKHVCKVNRFIEMWSDDNWVMNVIAADGKSKRKLEFKPVNVGPYADELLFKFGKNVLMMSATIVNRDVFCSSLSLNIDDVAFISIDSPFPIENRPIIYAPAGSMAQGDIDETLPKLVELVKLILEQHKGEKGIIHCLDEQTQVSMADGSLKSIADVKVGDGVISWSETVERFEVKEVDDVMEQGVRECIELTFDDGRTLICTPDHKLLTKGRGWVTAGELLPEDDLVTVEDDC